ADQRIEPGTRWQFRRFVEKRALLRTEADATRVVLITAQAGDKRFELIGAPAASRATPQRISLPESGEKGQCALSASVIGESMRSLGCPVPRRGAPRHRLRSHCRYPHPGVAPALRHR